MLHNGVVNTPVAASVWAQLKASHLAPIEYRVSPRFALPLQDAQADLAVDPPPLIRGYLRLGAKLLGPPAWDQDFNSADLPMMLWLKDIPEKYRRHFLRN
jgi:putative hemolysin